MDKKNRVVLDKKVRESSRVKRRAKLVAPPFKGGVTLVDVTVKSFVRSMKGFALEEEKHEASKFLFSKKRNE